MTKQELITKLKSLRNQESDTQAQIIEYLHEVMTRKIDKEMGYSGLFNFCHHELGYSKEECYARKAAAELVPHGSAELLRTKQLTITQIKNAAKKLRKHKEQNPRALLEQIAASKDPERKLAEIFPGEEKDHNRTQALADGKTLIQFAVTNEELELLNKIRNQQAHKNFDGNWHDLFMALATKEHKKSQKIDEARVVQHDSKPKAQSNVRIQFSEHVKRQEFKDAYHRCQYISAAGRRCEETHGLQIDHIHPLSKGGRNTIDNLRILCGAHNRYMAECGGSVRLH